MSLERNNKNFQRKEEKMTINKWTYYGDPAISSSGQCYWTDGSITDNANTTWISDPHYPQAPYIGDPLPPSNNTYPTLSYPYYYQVPDKQDGGKLREEIERLLDVYKQENKKEKNVMKIYEVIVVDAKECEILKKQDVIAKDTESAMLELDLTLEIRKKVKKDEVKFIFTEKGSFTKVEKKLKIKEDFLEEE
jgi:hypothetical protein